MTIGSLAWRVTLGPDEAHLLDVLVSYGKPICKRTLDDCMGVPGPEGPEHRARMCATALDNLAALGLAAVDGDNWTATSEGARLKGRRA